MVPPWRFYRARPDNNLNTAVERAGKDGVNFACINCHDQFNKRNTMKEIIVKNKKCLYLSFILIIFISFFQFALLTANSAGITESPDVYPGLLNFRFYGKYIFIFMAAIILFLLYRVKAVNSEKMKLESIVSSINHDTLLVIDSDGRIIRVNRSIENIIDNSYNDIIGRKFTDIIGVSDDKIFKNVLSSGISGKSVIESLKYKRKNGEIAFLEVIVEKIRSGGERVILLKDVTERIKNEDELKNMNSKLNKLITVDIFTGVLNRRGLEEQLIREYGRAQREGFSRFTMVSCLVEIDNFNRIKEQLGHAAGNVVLKEIGKRLARSVRSTDIVARINGYHFMVILPECGLAKAMQVAERMRLAVASCSLPDCQKSFNITASIGVSPLPPSLTSVENIVALTKLPLKRSKMLGKNRVSLAGNSMYKYDRSHEVRNEVVDTLLQGECFYQLACPIIGLDNKRVVGHELLSRCTIADLKTPDIFFGFALENNILTPVDIKCFHACMDVISHSKLETVWHINVFPSTLLSGDPENLLKVLRIPQTTSTLCVELSDQQLVGAPEKLKVVTRILKEAGILIAIDNLGVGRDSLETVRAIAPDIVKVDRLYVEGIAHDSIKRKALRQMFNTLSGTKIKCIADGVENESDLLVLQSMGVEYGQGGYLGKIEKVT